ncbi:MAG: DUF3108 domain-containing protein [Gemmatimonadaceae bacterium]|nr:DUF3108 domain-containing protein [Gemmatimonadaceae bacterium]MCW5825919.1 DUF3108 domain-containing protein [Gemmatimonadaceae bacterium]
MRVAHAVAGVVLGALAATDVTAQETPAPVPFVVGEALTYDVRFGAIKVGTGRMRVLGQVPIRGRPTWHVRFSVSGGTVFYRVNDVYESWMDMATLNSLQYFQDLQQGSRDRERMFEIYPDRAVYRETSRNDEDRPSVSDPLDDGSFLFFIRTVPLEVGRSYTFNRYFRPDRNPVIIRVLRRERVRVPAGEFNAIVVQPIIKTSGIFSEGGQAEIWLSDDDKRMMLQMRSRLSFGSLNLYLRSYRLSADSAEVEGR